MDLSVRPVRAMFRAGASAIRPAIRDRRLRCSLNVPERHKRWMQTKPLASVEADAGLSAHVVRPGVLPCKIDAAASVPVVRYASGRSKSDGKRLEAAEGEALLPFGVLRCEFEIEASPYDGLHRDLRFGAGDGGAEAEMWPMREGEVPIWPAGDVEFIGIGELALVAIGRAEQKTDSLACFDDLAADVDRLTGYATRRLHRAFEAKHFFDSRRDKFGVFA